MEPVFDYLLLFLPFAEHTQIAQFTAVPWIAFAKLMLFLPLAAISYGLTLFKLTSIYQLSWVKNSPAINEHHCEFYPGERASSFALLKWELYKWLKIAKKPVLLSAAMAVILYSVMMLLEYFQRTAMLVFELLFVITFFVLITTTFYLVLSVLQSICSVFRSTLGSTAAMLEPKMSARLLFVRAERLFTYSPWSWFVLMQEILLYGTVSFTIWYMATHFAVNQLYSLDLNLLKLFILGFTLLGQYVVLMACKFYAYTDALNNYYETVFG